MNLKDWKHPVPHKGVNCGVPLLGQRHSANISSPNTADGYNMEGTQNILYDTLKNVLCEFNLAEHSFIKRFAAGDYSPDAVRWWAMKMLPGSNRFNQAFLLVTSRIEDYRARVIMLKNIYTEHGELNSDAAHVALFMRFMRGINCPRIDIHEDDGSLTTPELRFKRFEIQDNEPLIWSLGRFAAIEIALPEIFTHYITGLRKVFPGIEDHTIEYFHIHCELDPEHTAELLEVASTNVHSENDVETFRDGARDMLLSISDMFSWLDANMVTDARSISHPQNRDNAIPRPDLWVNDRRLYDKDADLYDSIYFREHIYLRETEFILDNIRNVTRPTVLDLCSGTGSHAKLLSERGAHMTGIDRSPAMLEIARRKVPGARFIEADIRTFSLPERFDAVICMYGAIHYIEEPQDIVQVLRRAYEHLKTGGTMILDVRDRQWLPESHPGDCVEGQGIRKFWLKGRGVDDSDLYAVSAFDLNSRRHFLEVHNLFHTDPHRIAGWARMVGFSNVELHRNYQGSQQYSNSAGEETLALVARR